MTTFLKFPDEATATTVLADYISEQGEWLRDSHTHSLDPVGIIYQPTGNTITDENGITYPEMAPVDGWHVNFLGELPVTANDYIVYPTTPARVFAGVANENLDPVIPVPVS